MNTIRVNGEVLRRLRDDMGYSRSELAARTSVSVSLIRHLETGTTKMAQPVVVESLARPLGVHPRDLAPDYQPPMPIDLGRVYYDRERMREIVKRKGLSYALWAKRSGLRPETVSSLLNREKPSARVEILYAAAKGLGVPVGEISQALGVPPSEGARELYEDYGHPLRDVPPVIEDTEPPEVW
jgi:transcriptional regulator with XRE-family HTH domain